MLSELQQRLGEVKENVLLAQFTTFRIGGPAKYFYVAKNSEDIVKAARAAVALKIPYFILGAGSNVLVSDKGFAGLVIKIQNSQFTIDGNKIVAGAGVPNAVLARAAVDAGLTGIEWIVGVPGTIGGAVRGNAGCFGSEMKDVVRLVQVLAVGADNLLLRNSPDPLGHQTRRPLPQATPAPRLGSNSPRAQIVPPTATTFLEVVEMENEDCKFGYRDSIFKHDKNLIVLEVELALKKGNTQECEQKMKEILKKRSASQPKGLSSGCVFKNVDSRTIDELKINGRKWLEKIPTEFIEKRIIPAGWIIDQLGLKGKQIGGAQISSEHGNFIINTGQATAENIIMLISLIKEKARNNFGIQLEEEIQLVGF